VVGSGVSNVDKCSRLSQPSWLLGAQCTDMFKLKTCKHQKLDEEEPALDMDGYSVERDDEDYDTE